MYAARHWTCYCTIGPFPFRSFGPILISWPMEVLIKCSHLHILAHCLYYTCVVCVYTEWTIPHCENSTCRHSNNIATTVSLNNLYEYPTQCALLIMSDWIYSCVCMQYAIQYMCSISLFLSLSCVWMFAVLYATRPPTHWSSTSSSVQTVMPLFTGTICISGQLLRKTVSLWLVVGSSVLGFH